MDIESHLVEVNEKFTDTDPRYSHCTLSVLEEALYYIFLPLKNYREDKITLVAPYKALRVETEYFKEIKALYQAGLSYDGKHFEILLKLLKKRDVLTIEETEVYLQHYGPEDLKSCYEIAYALGMEECLTKLHFIKNYKRKNDIL